MDNNVNAAGAAVALFSDKELKDMYAAKLYDDHLEVIVGCTSLRYGDTVGYLRVYEDGLLDIQCDTNCCIYGPEGKLTPSELAKQKRMTPSAFEQHSQRESSKKWKYNIWVTINGEKVPLVKTKLLKYYNQSSKKTSGANKAILNKIFHRDEFVKCTKCSKGRRFRLRTKKECRDYHDAMRKVDWNCSDLTCDKVTCDHDEERASRKAYRGCSRSSTCKGCEFCVCFGCEMCRFSDCRCQTCSDFTSNAKQS